MHNSVIYWLSAEYKRQYPEIAMDASPAKTINKKLISIMAKWNSRFDELSASIASWFVKRTDTHVATSFANSMAVHSISVNMRVTPEVRTVLDSIYETQVNLIKSIPQRYLTQVTTLVQQSVTNGRDLAFLRDELQKQFGVSKRRAAFIALDQNNKASQAISKERCKSSGVKKGFVEHHAGGSKTYRHSHVEANGVEFDLDKGFWDSTEKRYVFPGELPGCKCTFRPKIE